MLPTKVGAGQSIRAPHINEMIAKLREIKTTPTNAGGLRARRESALDVVAVDTTGADYPTFSALAIESIVGDDPINDSGKRAVKVRKATADDAGRICVLGSAMSKGVASVAYISGLCPVFLTRTSDDAAKEAAERFEYAELKTDATALEASGAGSAWIVWEEEAESLTAAHLAFVYFPLGGTSGTFDNPRDLTYDDEHSEEARDDLAYTGEDEDEVMWDRRVLSIPAEEEEEEESFDGVTVTIPTGTAYYEDGDQTLYQYVADFTWDSNGCLVKISNERRIVIDVPVAYLDESEV